jgi:hypothetical protein
VVLTALLQVQGFTYQTSGPNHSGLFGPSLVVAILAMAVSAISLVAILWTVYKPRILVFRTERWLRKQS